ncbi:MAG: hypothetical protein WCW89_05045, partial [Bacteroidales bacterium]
MLLTTQNITESANKLSEIAPPEIIFDQIKNLSLADIGQQLFTWALSFGGRLLGAIVVFIIFRWVIKRIK